MAMTMTEVITNEKFTSYLYERATVVVDCALVGIDEIAETEGK